LKFDYVTDVDYNDGLANEVQAWDYDAAGNRVSASANPGTWTYDNLNRMTGTNVTPAGQYMTMSRYDYRADGTRVRKQIGGEVMRSCFDGQMPVEKDVSTGTLTRNFVGA
jgi:hypothetical protein